MPATLIGPTATLPGDARRIGASGTVLQNGKTLGEATGIDYNVTVQQIPVVIAGLWRTDTKAGGEERAGTLSVQDLSDYWALIVWRYIRARRDNNAAYIKANLGPFDLVSKLADPGAPMESRWSLMGCEFFEYSGGFSQDDGVILRQIPFSFRDDKPLQAFEYTDAGTKMWDGSAY